MCCIGWGGCATGVAQWNGQWPPQSTYWNVPYGYGNAQPVNNSQHPPEGGFRGVASADRTPPPPQQDATPPPPPAEDARLHQPRIQQYSHTGYTMELPAPIPHPLPVTPSTQPPSEKLNTPSNELPVKKEGGLLPLPNTQQLQSQHTSYHKPGSQYGQSWAGGRERPDGQSPARKRRSRWELKPEGEDIVWPVAC